MQMPDGVQMMTLDSVDKVWDLWEKLNNIKGLFDDFHKDRVDIFMNKLRSADTVWLERTDGNGILYLTDVIPNLSATGHIVYWDKRLRGREEFTLDVLQWLMQTIPLVKLNVYLPDYAKVARNFTERLGFKREGKLRNWSYHEGRLYDMFAFGITLEEALDGKLNATASDNVSSTTPEPVSGLSTAEAEAASTASGSSGDTVQSASSKQSE